MNLTIDFSEEVPNGGNPFVLEDVVRDAITAALVHEKVDGDVIVSVTFTDNEEIHKLNSRFRHIDRLTDVLSFPMYSFTDGDVPPENEEFCLGDVVLSVEQAIKQAEEYGHSLKREIAFLCVHSTLHLLGYDHETSPEDEKEMFALQEEIMNELGITRDFTE